MSRALPIIAIESGSAAARAGLRAGERIRLMNGVELRDVIDLRFEGAEEEVEVEVENGDGRRRTLMIERLPGESLGIETEEMTARTCANKCVFCFIDQMPAGRRRGLYVRDEDFRFSFLHGNYVTLTNTRERDIVRMIEQGMSPIYVSVHATDPAVRARLLGIDDTEKADVVPVIERLTAGGIHIHAQIVLCPGRNDGPLLEETVETLAHLHPGVVSVAVVPLGMTSHRAGLPALEAVTVDTARTVMEQCRALGDRLVDTLGERFVYLADEWYFLTGKAIPEAEHYHGFPQLEDGVGMTRRFIDHLAGVGESSPIIERVRGRTVTLVTGVMAAPVVEEHLVEGLLRQHAARVELVVVENDFLGRGITVSGLLAGGDIGRAVNARWAAAGNRRSAAGGAAAIDAADPVLLPPNCLNGRALFLDDVSLDELSAALGREIVIGLGDETFHTNPVWEKT